LLETAINNSAGSSTGASSGIGANSVLGRIASGDRAAMRECLSLYGGLVWSMARTFTTNAADAEDAVEDVFIHLWQRAGALMRRKAVRCSLFLLSHGEDWSIGFEGM
jgi:DNA-directed RNA polymerase specialized sigma24 family protein